MSFQEELQSKIRNIARMFDYAAGTTKIQDFLETSGLAPAEAIEKKEKRKFSKKILTYENLITQIRIGK